MLPRRIALHCFGAFTGTRVGAVAFFLCLAGGELLAQEGQGPEEVRRRAAEAYEAGRLQEALPDYERLVSLYPEEACLHGRLAGCALIEPGRLAMVRRHLRIALRKGCGDLDLGFHQARLAHLEYDFERAGDLYAAYLASAGKKARFKAEAERAVAMCRSVQWDPAEAVALEVYERISADPEASFRYYEPDVDGLRLVSTPRPLRSKADLKAPAGRMALHDGDTVLVFSSLGKKGSSGSDLFRVSIRMGEYSEPIRLEGGVNSPYDEQDAYLSKEGVLYFASNRPGGLGGFDIYAVPCGLDGVPTAQPYRLPYPINSVNDDVFFIPEAGGGAWMASDRAALEGRVHAYRLGLGEGQMATGSVAWSSDEVADEGLTLRVFAQGEEMASGALDGEDMGHLAFQGMEGVRLVLEDREGNVLAEAFGDGVGAWELRKGSDGWMLEGQTDVAADWAVLSDLQAGSKPKPVEGASSTTAEVADAEEKGEGGWSSWLSGRLASEDLLASASDDLKAEEDEVAGFEAGSSNDSEGTVDRSSVMDGAEEDAASPEATFDSEKVDASGESSVENGGTAVGTEWKDQPIEVLNSDVPRSAQDLSFLVEERPDVAIEIWERRAKEVLVLEQDFLDEPDFSKAGELFDLIDALEAWQPDASMMDNRWLDGVQVDDIRDMLDEWSRAVQSATSPSLAAVAGEAALAYRRERLAIRELWDASGTDITPLQLRWSQWLDARRDVPGVDPAMSELSMQEGDLLLSRWSETLSSWRDVWSRKEAAGWRGDWVGRQQDQLDRNGEVWEEFKEALLEETSEPGSMADAASEDVADQDSSMEEGRTDPSQVDESPADPAVPAEVVVEGPLLSFGEAGPEGTVMTLLFPVDDQKGFDPPWDERQQEAAQELKEEWAEAARDNARVVKAWERLERALEGSGMAPVLNGDAWDSLEPGVRSAYLEVVETSVQALEDLCRADRPEKPAFSSEGPQVPLEFEESFGTEEIQSLLARWEALTAGDENLADLSGQVRKAEGGEAFDLVLERQRLLLESEAMWRLWSEDWRQLQSDWDAALLAFEDEAVAEAKMEEEQAMEPNKGEVGAEEVLDSATADDDAVEGNGQEEVETESEKVAENDFMETEGGEDLASIGNDRGDEAELKREDPVSVNPSTEAAEANVSLVANASAEQTEGAGRSGDATGLPAADDGVRRASVAKMLEEGLDAAGLIVRQLDSLNALVEGANEGQSAVVMELVSAWREFDEIQVARPDGAASRAASMAWDKRRFFNERRLKKAWSDWEDSKEVADASRAEGEPLVAEDPLPPVVDLSANSRSLEESGRADVSMESADAVVLETVKRQDREVAGYGVVLPEAEIVGRSNAGGGRGRGLTLRPIEREALERAVLGAAVAVDATAPLASERFAAEAGAPLLEGVEYKVQVGAFRKALPAALFSAFDPMWAQTLSNGITRYMAGSFSAYDAAVIARDAIRGLGYKDAFVVRFVDGERVVGSSRPEPSDLAVEREEERQNAAGLVAAPVASEFPLERRGGASSAVSVPRVKEDIPTWDDVEGRVFSVQIGAFRGVPDANSLADLGTLTREDAGVDGWLRLYSGRFPSESEAREHRNKLRDSGRTDAFIVVYVNGRRIPLSEASTTAVSPLPGAVSSLEGNSVPVATDVDVVVDEVSADVAQRWYIELGVFSSTIPVRLANAILDAPLDWAITSLRDGGLTRYRTRTTDEQEARGWLESARERGFGNARLNQEEAR